MLGLTQKQMADRIGVTYQQVNKYEQGANRISVKRLFDLAEALGVQPADLITALELKPRVIQDAPAQRRLLQLAAAFAHLSADEQTAVMGMVQLLGKAAR